MAFLIRRKLHVVTRPPSFGVVIFAVRTLLELVPDSRVAHDVELARKLAPVPAFHHREHVPKELDPLGLRIRRFLALDVLFFCRLGMDRHENVLRPWQVRRSESDQRLHHVLELVAKSAVEAYRVAQLPRRGRALRLEQVMRRKLHRVRERIEDHRLRFLVFVEREQVTHETQVPVRLVAVHGGRPPVIAENLRPLVEPVLRVQVAVDFARLRRDQHDLFRVDEFTDRAAQVRLARAGRTDVEVSRSALEGIQQRRLRH